ncbi:hypothetical protein [Komagataeibacter sp. FNDCR2]|uniref:hypothetical protein n=1 Tax=Komagataeibacter sp. FNDCR2 TaxID=2878682 RepID=UPI001E2B3E3A|nr:hypothetical protein [Komagataeibacter sp. FNDCR2]MCE2574844.1 hypothetical protein [Komagataeibacter sp. FNDCR2]
MSETLSRPKCVQTPAPAVVVEDQIDRVLDQAARPAPVQPPVDLLAFATPTQVGRRLALLQKKLEELEKNKRLCSPIYDRHYEEREHFWASSSQ